MTALPTMAWEFGPPDAPEYDCHCRGELASACCDAEPYEDEPELCSECSEPAAFNEGELVCHCEADAEADDQARREYEEERRAEAREERWYS